MHAGNGSNIILILCSGLADQSVGSDGNEPQEEQLLGCYTYRLWI